MLECDLYKEIDGVHIYYVDLKEDDAREEYAASCLNAAEKKRMQEYQVAEVRRHHVLMRATLRTLLCERLECDNARLDFEKLPHGKPYARIDGAPAAIQFNVTHGDGHGLIAVTSHGSIGVDLETYSDRRNFAGISKAVFGTYEQEALTVVSGAQQVRLFYRLWTMKEALLKALGTGLSLAPASFQVPTPMLVEGDDSGVFCFPHEPEIVWRLESMAEERFAAAVAWIPHSIEMR